MSQSTNWGPRRKQFEREFEQNRKDDVSRIACPFGCDRVVYGGEDDSVCEHHPDDCRAECDRQDALSSAVAEPVVIKRVRCVDVSTEKGDNAKRAGLVVGETYDVVGVTEGGTAYVLRDHDWIFNMSRFVDVEAGEPDLSGALTPAEAKAVLQSMGLSEDRAERKAAPMHRGLKRYFPNALAYVSHVSYVGNEQHNPGEPMHWAYDKSTDEGDCIERHQAEAGTFDTDGLRHSGKVAWRALAQLERELLEADPTLKPGLGVRNFERLTPHESAGVRRSK